MYIKKVPNRNSPPAVLRPDSYREGDQVKKRTLANLSKLPDDLIENLKLALKGATLSMTVSVQGGIVKQPVALILWEDSPGAAEKEKYCLS